MDWSKIGDVLKSGAEIAEKVGELIGDLTDDGKINNSNK